MGVSRLESAKQRRAAEERKPLALWPWERATLPVSEISAGWVPGRHLREVTLILTGGFMVFISLAVPHAGWLVLLALPLGRLVALDLTTHTLPDVYTLPLLAMGIAHAVGQGTAWDETLPALVLVALGILGMNRIGSRRLATVVTPAHAIKRERREESSGAGFGGGDLKLLLAMFAWLPAQQACFAIGLGCLCWLPCGCWQPKRAQPFGVALALGWLGMLALAERF